MTFNSYLSCSTDNTKKSARCPLAVRKPSESATAKENIPPEACVRKQFKGNNFLSRRNQKRMSYC